MIIVVRRVGPTCWHRLGRCGKCRVGLGQIVGCFKSNCNRIIFLEDGQ